ncbi:MAG: hypothetical protein MJ074_06770 [Oscillospiraceae bacterium]|nr:hypothetical protein [Oscillospiraceae bacterium]
MDQSSTPSNDLIRSDSETSIISHQQRKQYEHILQTLHQTVPFSEACTGKSNPYTGATISTQSDYEAYLQTRALSLLYQNLYSQAQDDFAEKLAIKDAKLSSMMQKYHEEIYKVSSSRSSKRFWRLTSLACILVIFVLFSKLPSIRQTSYDKGFSEGTAISEEQYNDWYESGYNSGFLAGNVAVLNSIPNQNPPSRSSGSISNNFPAPESSTFSYIGNKNSKKFHSPSCSSLPDQSNRIYFDTRTDAISSGYDPCKRCWP